MQRGLHSLQTYYVAAIPKGKVNECERHMRFWHIKYEQHSSTACVGAMELQKYLLDQYLLMHLRNSRKKNQEHFNCLIWHPSHIVYSTLRGRRAETMLGKRKIALASQMSGHFYSAYIMPAGRPARIYFHVILISWWVERQRWFGKCEEVKKWVNTLQKNNMEWGTRLSGDGVVHSNDNIDEEWASTFRGSVIESCGGQAGCVQGKRLPKWSLT